MGGNVKIQVIGHQGIKLDTQQAALGQHAAMLLDEITEILLQVRVRDDHCLTEEGAYLGAADVEHIAQPGDIRQCHIVALRHQAVAQPGTVQEQVQAQLPADTGQLFQLGETVEGTVFRGIGDVHQLGLDRMLKAGICPVGQHRLLHLGSGDLAVAGRNRQDLMASGFHGAGLMDIDMAAHRAQGALVGPQSRCNDRQVRLGAAHKKVHSGVRTGAEGFDFFCGRSAVFILSVAQGLDHICTDQGIQHLLVAALGIVIVKVDHLVSPKIEYVPYYPFLPGLSRWHTPLFPGIGFFSTQHRRGAYERQPGDAGL